MTFNKRVNFSYIIEGSVCYLCICEHSYPRKLAFSYLEELAKEFNMSYGNEVDKPGLRPYAFVKFGKKCMQFFEVGRLNHYDIRYVYAKNKENISRYPNSEQLDQIE